MQINTRNETLSLTKREHKLLTGAKALLLQISKHGSGSLAENAAEAAEGVGSVHAELGRTSKDLPGQTTFIKDEASE